VLKTDVLVAHKAFRVKDGKLHFLFRGHEGSTTVPTDTWLRSKAKVVRDGRGRSYRAGFHILMEPEAIAKFDKLTKGKYVIRKVMAMDIHPKPGSRTGVWLARWIFVTPL
jgi:hypothetical protein